MSGRRFTDRFDRSTDEFEWSLEVPEQRGDDLTGQPVESTTPTEPKRWISVVTGAAIVLVVVVGAVVADRISGDDVPDDVSSPRATVPVSSPGVADSLSSNEWSRVPYDEAIFGGVGDQWMSSVTAGGPGLVAVGSAGSDVRTRIGGGDQDAAVWTSVDGLTWSRVPHDNAVFGGSGDQEMWSVTVGGPGLVAVGGSVVWTSVDGITWSRVPHNEGVFGEANMNSVTVGGPGLVAVGAVWSDYPGSDAAVWTSVDGITWSRVPHDEAVFDGADMNSVTVGGPGLVAVGSAHDDGEQSAAVWTSVDGITWSLVPHDEAVFGGASSTSTFPSSLRVVEMNSVTVGGPGLVAVGSDGTSAAVWTSVDGITWSRVRHNEAVFGREDVAPGRHVIQGTAMNSVTTAGPGLVAVGGPDWGSGGAPRHESEDGPLDDSHAAVWSSVDGITWSRVPHNDAVFGAAGGQGVLSVTAAGPGLVAVGSDGSGGDFHAAVWVAATQD